MECSNIGARKGTHDAVKLEKGGVEALVSYFQASDVSPVKLTWFAAIKKGNYSTW